MRSWDPDHHIGLSEVTPQPWHIVHGPELIYRKDLVLLIEHTQSESPGCSPHYIRLTDALLQKFLGDALAKPPSPVPPPSNESFRSYERLLASIPTFSTTPVETVHVEEETSPAILEVLVESILENQPRFFSIAHQAGVEVEYIFDMEETFKSGKVFYAHALLGPGNYSVAWQSDGLLRKLQDHKVGQLSDKVTTRSLAEGFFPQPDFLDARFLNRRDHYHFGTLAPTRLFDAIPDQFFAPDNEIAVFETAAFTLVRSGDRFVSIPHDLHGGYRSPHLGFVVDPACQETKALNLMNAILGVSNSDARSLLRSKYHHLERAGYVFTEPLPMPSEMEAKRPRPEDLVDLLFGLKESVYIKGSTSSRGRAVLRLSFDADGDPILESSAEDILDKLALAIDRCEEALGYEDSIIEASGDGPPEEYRARRRLNVHKITSSLIASFDDVIVEREIPFERVEGCRVEFRLICGAVPGDDSSPRVIAHYCKESADSVAANISIAGRGASSHDTLRKLLQERIPNLGDAEIERQANRYSRELIAQTERFAAHYHNVRGLKTFAVDLIPVWNDEGKTLEFWLLEVQDRFGYEGLRRADPEGALRVDAMFDRDG